MEQHGYAIRSHALAMIRQGASYAEVSNRLNVPHGTISWWRHEERRALGITVERTHDCPRCCPRDFDRRAYSYVLGLYLGDGHIVSKPKQHHLSIFCCDSWPGLITAAEDAMRAVMPLPRVRRRQLTGCTEVKSFTRHWTCLFPQHGPGKKYRRRVALEAWQQDIVEAHPWEFIRGLIHSDGCRIVNWTTKVVGGERKRYEYPRYFFSNKSDDIRALFTEALRMVGVRWTILARGADPFNVSVARKESVALMDAHVGAKY
ncbi:helix-turn-helix domain-containing protein [Streptomyces xiamenensis]|uniref:helix-turn-helix domain-containing protein n=1 Tax=Streptomyces xiamenensis TaxID=408015 RepID=UPI00342D7645